MPRKQKIEAGEKVKIVQECLGQKVSIDEAARAAGVGHQTIRSWIGIYENHGIEGFTQKRNRHYTVETKMAAIIEYLNGGNSLQAICKKYLIQNTRQLRNWLKVYNAHGDFNSIKQSGDGNCMKQRRATVKEEYKAIALSQQCDN